MSKPHVSCVINILHDYAYCLCKPLRNFILYVHKRTQARMYGNKVIYI